MFSLSRLHWLGVWLVVALATRGLVAFRSSEQLTIDRDAYLGIARNVSLGVGYCQPESTEPTAFRPPLLPILLGGASHLVGWPGAVLLVNLASTAAVIWSVSRLARRAAEPAESESQVVDAVRLVEFVPLAIVSLSPLLIQYSIQPMTEVLCTALVTMIWLRLIPRGGNRQSPVGAPLHSPQTVAWSSRAQLLRGCGLGVLGGLCILCRPTGLIWIAGLYLLSAWQWFSGSRQRSTTDRAGPAVPLAPPSRVLWGTLLGLAISLGPWIGRNWWVLGTPVVTTTHGGYTLLLGNNPVFYRDVVAATGTVVWPADLLDRWQRQQSEDYTRETGLPFNEIATDRWLARRAWQSIRAEPWAFLHSAVLRVAQLWNVAPQADADHVSPGLLIAVRLWYTSVFILAALGLYRVWRAGELSSSSPGGPGSSSRFWLWWPGLWLIVSLTLVHTLYWSNTRMRAPAEPVLAVLAGQAFRPRRHTLALR